MVKIWYNIIKEDDEFGQEKVDKQRRLSRPFGRCPDYSGRFCREHEH